MRWSKKNFDLFQTVMIYYECVCLVKQTKSKVNSMSIAYYVMCQSTFFLSFFLSALSSKSFIMNETTWTYEERICRVTRCDHIDVNFSYY